MIARKHGKGATASFTVRKIAAGVGVEKTYPLHSPLIEKIEVVKKSKSAPQQIILCADREGKRAKIKGVQVHLEKGINGRGGTASRRSSGRRKRAERIGACLCTQPIARAPRIMHQCCCVCLVWSKRDAGVENIFLSYIGIRYYP